MTVGGIFGAHRLFLRQVPEAFVFFSTIGVFFIGELFRLYIVKKRKKNFCFKNLEAFFSDSNRFKLCGPKFDDNRDREVFEKMKTFPFVLFRRSECFR